MDFTEHMAIIAVVHSESIAVFNVHCGFISITALDTFAMIPVLDGHEAESQSCDCENSSGDDGDSLFHFIYLFLLVGGVSLFVSLLYHRFACLSIGNCDFFEENFSNFLAFNVSGFEGSIGDVSDFNHFDLPLSFLSVIILA